MKKILEVRNLKTYFKTDEGVLKAVDDVSFVLKEREVLGIIGESGCGKSVIAQSIMRIVPSPGEITSGNIYLNMEQGNRVDLTIYKQDSLVLRKIRCKEIGMIFQEPMTSLSPVHTIGFQIMEAILEHTNFNKKEARERAITLLNNVEVPDPQQRIDYYPHQLSGGLRQRAIIAMALSCNPAILIADEPTTALDVTVQAQILNLLRDLQHEYEMSVLFITHNLGVIAEIADRVMVMYLGKVVEYGSTADIFFRPHHPYTKGLLKAIPKIGKQRQIHLDTIEGSVPIPIDLKNQCGFYKRCSEIKAGVCDNGVPELIEAEPNHFVRCVHYQ